MFEKTVLIVDDMETNRMILREIFAKEYDVLEAGNGEEALELIEKYKEDISIVLLDIYMPVLNGYEVLKALSANEDYQNIPVIMITGDSSQSAELKVLDYGSRDVIIKPFDARVISRRVNNLVELYSYKKELFRLKQLLDEQ